MEKDIKSDKKLGESFNPSCADDCGMEEAHGRGFISGPSPVLPQKPRHEPVRPY